MEKEIKYLILEKHNILNNIKYQVGNRYKLDEFNSLEIYENISDIDFLNFSFKWSIENVDIYEIEAYQMVNVISMTEESDVILCTTDFKIRKKLNYKEMNIEEENSEIIFGFKNRDEKILNKILGFAKKNCYKSGFQLVSLGIEKYLKELRKFVKISKEGIINGLLNLGRNEDLDRFIDYRDSYVLCKIADIGRPQDLDVLINNGYNKQMEHVLNNKRHKDIDEIMERGYSNELAINTGVDKYLDRFIKNKSDYYIPIIAKNGIFRKKDLDIILSLNRDNDMVIADYGFDDHLDYLSTYSNEKRVLECILQFHRKCDYDRIKARGYEIDDDVCDENLLW